MPCTILKTVNLALMEHRFWCPIIVFQTIDHFFFLLHFTSVHSVVLFVTRNSEHYTSAMICVGILGLNLYSHLEIYDKTVQRKIINPSTFFVCLFSLGHFSRKVIQIMKQVPSIIICSWQGAERIKKRKKK